jgi:hypothetical protein
LVTLQRLRKSRCQKLAESRDRLSNRLELVAAPSSSFCITTTLNHCLLAVWRTVSRHHGGAIDGMGATKRLPQRAGDSRLVPQSLSKT